MKDKKVKYKKGSLKKIVNSLMKHRFKGSIKFDKGEILFSEGKPIFVLYDNQLGKKNLESIDKTFNYKIEELNDEELLLRIKWYELICEVKKGENREEIIENLGIQDVDKEFMIKILKKENLLYLLGESDNNASSKR